MVAAVNVADFDFDLPDGLIAQNPPDERGSSRLLVLNRTTGAIEQARQTLAAAWFARTVAAMCGTA